jgi:hypothetical protein
LTVWGGWSVSGFITTGTYAVRSECTDLLDEGIGILANSFVKAKQGSRPAKRGSGCCDQTIESGAM